MWIVNRSTQHRQNQPNLTIHALPRTGKSFGKNVSRASRASKDPADVICDIITTMTTAYVSPSWHHLPQQPHMSSCLCQPLSSSGLHISCLCQPPVDRWLWLSVDCWLFLALTFCSLGSPYPVFWVNFIFVVYFFILFLYMDKKDIFLRCPINAILEGNKN